ncbi:MAG: hypothetical protein PVI04_08295, partial [Anaerolineales bacterium]
MQTTTQSKMTILRKYTMGFDPLVILLTAGMLIFGLVMVYSASWDVSWRLYGDPNTIFQKQITNAVLGVGA